MFLQVDCIKLKVSICLPFFLRSRIKMFLQDVFTKQNKKKIIVCFTSCINMIVGSTERYDRIFFFFKGTNINQFK